jgi:hypothetical protein
LRNEQENFLSAYRFLSSVISRIKTLTDLHEELDQMPRTASQSENSSRLKKVLDFVKLNFGSIEWEMGGFKRKIMVNTATTSTNNGSKPLTFMPFSRSISVNQAVSKV